MSRRSLGGLARDRRAVTAVEFGVVGLALLILIFGSIEFGRLLWARQALQATAIEAARCIGILAASCAAGGAYSQGKSQTYGFSLIEVIVVVLIIGIASTITVLSISYANASNANHCAKRLSSLLDLTRTQSMGMVEDSISLRLEKTAGGNYDAVMIKKDGGSEIELDREEIGNSALTISCCQASGEQVLSDIDSIEFQYKKNTGAFDSTITPYTSIKIVGSKTATVILVTETGRNYVN
jgi:prepilin-type N-terminal cleavage/methylation domain-containing protein